MKISAKRRFFLNILTFGDVGGTFSLSDTVQLTARDAQIGGKPLDEYVVCNIRSHAKSGIHKSIITQIIVHAQSKCAFWND